MAHSGYDIERAQMIAQMMAISIRGLFAHYWLWKVKLQFESVLKVGQDIIDYIACIQCPGNLSSVQDSKLYLSFRFLLELMEVF